jgi:hypothetical protein
MKATLRFKGKGEPTEVYLVKSSYTDNGLMAVRAMCSDDHSPFAILSVNPEEPGEVPEGHFWFKNYSENETFLDQMIEQGIVEKVGVTMKQGFVEFELVKVLF